MFSLCIPFFYAWAFHFFIFFPQGLGFASLIFENDICIRIYSLFFVNYCSIESFPLAETTVPLPLPQEKYLMHMPESILILHQLKVAHEALKGLGNRGRFFVAFCPEAFQVPKMMEAF